jgi:thiamine-phosphate pyrophosphorylase|tara:strand:- start:6712 stop:7362 length:651 start_codon:yes stop_codon:yes gene_type:complete
MQTFHLPSARLYGILDTGYVDASSSAWEKTCETMLGAGIDLLQLRAKGSTRDERRKLLHRIQPLFAGSDTPLILNDDLLLACEEPDVGLHLGQDDTPVEEARKQLGPDRILGLSTHSPAQAAEAIAHADLIDYFAVGPVFATPTKPTYEPVGLELVKHVASLQPPLPWFCIGGIKLGNVAEVLEAGAAAVVVVSEILRAEEPARLIQRYHRALKKA